MSHPFGELLSTYRARKAGLTLARLANLAGYDKAVLVRMGQGHKDLTGPSGRERVVRVIGILHNKGALSDLDEANALLASAQMPPLFAGAPDEAALIRGLPPSQEAFQSAAPMSSGTNLPAQLTRFIGREREVAKVQRLVTTNRLVTLTGTGGVGKTRLALQVAKRLVGADGGPAFADGVWLVELAPLSSADVLPDAILAALGVPATDAADAADAADLPAMGVLRHRLRNKRTLLVLDNCEHLIAGCAALVDDLLCTCPHLSILATSREPLNIAGEVTWRVPSLASNEAMQLFVDRARAARPEFAVTARNTDAVAAICARLDGIPLAVELAAARVAGLTAHQIAARLDDRFNLLSGGRRSALPRHQTLRALIDWSYDLLSTPEQALLRRLAVFAGGWTVELVEQVCADPAPGAPAILPLLLDLVNKSLVMMDEQEGEPRYRLLETVRQYAAEKLREDGEAEALQRRHAEAYAGLLERAAPHFRSPEEAHWFDVIDRELDNVRAALAWSKTAAPAAGDVVAGLRLAGGLWPYWRWHEHAAEGRRWLEELLPAMPPDTPPRVRAQALLGAGNLTITRLGEGTASAVRQAVVWLEEALGLFRSLGDPLGVAYALCGLGGVAVRQIDFARAQSLLEQSLATVRPLDRPWVTAYVLRQLAGAADWLQDYDRARALNEEVLAVARAAGDWQGVAGALVGLGNVAIRQFDFALALEFLREGLLAARRAGATGIELSALGLAGDACRQQGHFDQAWAYYQEQHARSVALEAETDTALALLHLGEVACDEGNYRQAYDLLAQSLSYFHRRGGFYDMAGLECMAAVAGGRHQPERAARLFGAAGAFRAARRQPIPKSNIPRYERYVAGVRAQLDAATFAADWAEGQAMTLERAMAYALQGGEADEPPVR